MSTCRASPPPPAGSKPGASPGVDAPGKQRGKRAGRGEPWLARKLPGSSRRSSPQPPAQSSGSSPTPGRPRAVPWALTALAHPAGAQHGQLDVLGQEAVGGGLGNGREQTVPRHGWRPHGERVGRAGPATESASLPSPASGAAERLASSAGTRVRGDRGGRPSRQERRFLKGWARAVGAGRSPPAPPPSRPLPRWPGRRALESRAAGRLGRAHRVTACRALRRPQKARHRPGSAWEASRQAVPAPPWGPLHPAEASPGH